MTVFYWQSEITGAWIVSSVPTSLCDWTNSYDEEDRCYWLIPGTFTLKD